MITALLAKIFGTKNDRELKRMRPIVKRINELEESMIALSDAELTEKTNEFRERIANGESLDSLLPEAFAVVRETGKRKLNMRHFDVQLMGGMVLHSGSIAEMRTGEGKTLTATLPLYLNALAGKGAHLVTVNDYLARRDAEWMRPIYNHLGLEVGIIQNNMSDADRKKAYNADITYGTNNEFGFDYLRDNMKFDLDDYAQRELSYAIVDEVDSILIDEARTPLIISGAAEKGSNLYQIANRAVLPLKQEDDFEVDEKQRTVHLTESGNDKIEKLLNIKNLYAPENILVLHHVQQALRANALFKKDVQYVVREGEVLIVDEFTGRIMSGRRYSDGLHQALEAKEGVQVERENQTLASITLQNYFRLYGKLAGMTGTAVTESAEFHNIYKLGVIVVPTHKPMIRDDQPDIIFLDAEDKYLAVIQDIVDCHQRRQPVLVGTISIETSELLSSLLTKAGVTHSVLNAKQHAREADIVAEAGKPGYVTIATNMAGRGTDIKLEKEALDAGGLRIIGTERHESRRIDNQLRGRAGRQGDPGSSKFYLSLDDDLMRIFGGERLKKTMERVGMKKGESIESKMISKRIESAQQRVEKHNFEIRKSLIEYDDVLNQQRKVVYGFRSDILRGSDHLQDLIREIIVDVSTNLCNVYCPTSNCDEQMREQLFDSLTKFTGLPESEFSKADFNESNVESLKKKVIDFLLYTHEQFRSALPSDIVGQAEKWILLETIDQYWKLHMQTLDRLKEGIHLRSYAQKNPIIEYKRESFAEFEQMMQQVKWDIGERMFRLKPEHFSQSQIHEIEEHRQRELDSMNVNSGKADDSRSEPKKRDADKVGRNDPCTCGSNKKYKKCCGSNS